MERVGELWDGHGDVALVVGGQREHQAPPLGEERRRCRPRRHPRESGLEAAGRVHVDEPLKREAPPAAPVEGHLAGLGLGKPAGVLAVDGRGRQALDHERDGRRAAAGEDDRRRSSRLGLPTHVEQLREGLRHLEAELREHRVVREDAHRRDLRYEADEVVPVLAVGGHERHRPLRRPRLLHHPGQVAALAERADGDGSAAPGRRGEQVGRAAGEELGGLELVQRGVGRDVGDLDVDVRVRALEVRDQHVPAGLGVHGHEHGQRDRRRACAGPGGARTRADRQQPDERDRRDRTSGVTAGTRTWAIHRAPWATCAETGTLCGSVRRCQSRRMRTRTVPAARRRPST